MLLMEYKPSFQFKKFVKMQNLDNVVHICYEQNRCAEATVTCFYHAPAEFLISPILVENLQDILFFEIFSQYGPTTP